VLFDQTKQLFTRWLFYGIATMFSLAVLSVMVTLAMDVVIAVAGSFWVGNLITGGKAEGVNSMAMQQGGLGLLLTMLIISAPPIAGNFFNGMMGTFAAYSSFGTFGGSTAPGARGPNSPPADNAAPRTTDRVDNTVQSAPLLSQLTQHRQPENTQATSNEVRKATETTRGIAGTQQQYASNATTAPLSPTPLPPPPRGGGTPS
jgi:type IV secretion system protein VirB6